MHAIEGSLSVRGPYRDAASPDASSLLVPRRHVSPWTGAVLVGAVVAALGPIVVWLVHAAGAWGEVAENAGIGLVAVLGVHFACAAVVAALGTRVVRGDRATAPVRMVPLATLAIVALAPAAVALGAHVIARRALDAPALGADEIEALGVLSGRLAGQDTIVLVGVLSSALLCVVAAIASAGALITVDAQQLALIPSGWSTGSAIGVGVLLVDVIVHVLARPEAPLSAPGGACVVILSAALAGPALDRARACRSASGGGAALADGAVCAAVFAAALFALSAWLLDAAAYLVLERPALATLADVALDPRARTAVVAALVPSHDATRVVSLGDAGAAALAMAPAMLGGARGPKWLLYLAVATLVAALPVGGSAFVAALRRAALTGAGDRAVRLLTARGVGAPRVTAPTSLATSPDVTVLASGKAIRSARPRRDGGALVVYADGQAPFGDVFAAVGPRTTRVLLAGAPELPDLALGELAPLVGPSLPGHAVTIAHGLLEPTLGKETLTVVKVEHSRARVSLTRFDSGLTIGLGRTETSLASDADARDGLRVLLRGQHKDVDVRYTPTTDEGAEEVLHDLDVLARLLPPEPERRVAIMTATRAAACDLR